MVPCGCCLVGSVHIAAALVHMSVCNALCTQRSCITCLIANQDEAAPWRIDFVLQFRPEPEISYFDIQEASGLRNWLRNQFMSVVYGYDPNADDPLDEQVPQYLESFYLSSTSILGPIRLRQLRVRANSCKVSCRVTVLVLSPHASSQIIRGGHGRRGQAQGLFISVPYHPLRGRLQVHLAHHLLVAKLSSCQADNSKRVGVQVDDRWTNVTRTCHAAYTSDRSFFKRDAAFSSAWPEYQNRETLRLDLVASLANDTALQYALDQANQTKNAGRETFGDTESAASVRHGQRVADRLGLTAQQMAAVNATMQAFEFQRVTNAGPYRGHLLNLYRHALPCLHHTLPPS